MHQSEQSDREQAYARIKRLIAAGAILPDEAISERSLAVQLGLGRTPVREALKAFARDGLLEVVPMRGTFLRSPSIDDVREIYEVRLAVEGMAAYLVAQRGVTPELSAFRKRLSSFRGRRNVGSIAAMHRVGWDFHEAIVRATGNRRMLQTYETLRLPIMALRSGRPVGSDQATKSLHEHLAILDAIESGDEALAQTRIMDHLASVLEARTRVPRVPIYVPKAVPPGKNTVLQQPLGRKKEERLK
ncbi:MAG: GntR family transcriptional regulator [Hyphomicrobiaceae bacterium]|nr:GntR family transcriptional regulator [Hyphomicrobiaceae bacterium]